MSDNYCLYIFSSTFKVFLSTKYLLKIDRRVSTD
nr:MAG TPA: hypothetical protein [Caudoviricetes sp.]